MDLQLSPSDGKSEKEAEGEKGEERVWRAGDFHRILSTPQVFHLVLSFLPKMDWLTLRKENGALQVSQEVKGKVELALSVAKKMDVRSFLGPDLVFPHIIREEESWKNKENWHGNKVSAWLGPLAPRIEVLGGGPFMPDTLLHYRHLKEVDVYVSREQSDEIDWLPCTNQLDLEFFGNAKKLEKIGFFGDIDYKELTVILRTLASPFLVHLDLSTVENLWGHVPRIGWDGIPVEQLEFFGFPSDVVQADFDKLLARATRLQHLILPRRCVAWTINLVAWDWSTAIRQIEGLVSLRVREYSNLDATSLVGLIPYMKKMTKLSFPVDGASEPGIWPLLREITQSSEIRELELRDLDGSRLSRVAVDQLFRELSKADKIQSLAVENTCIDDSLQPLNLTSLTFSVNCIEEEDKFQLLDLKINFPLQTLNLCVAEDFDGTITVDCGPEVRKTLRKLRVAGYKDSFADLTDGLLIGLEQIEILDFSEFRCKRVQCEYYRRIRDFIKLPPHTRFLPPVYFS